MTQTEHIKHLSMLAMLEQTECMDAEQIAESIIAHISAKEAQ